MLFTVQGPLILFIKGKFWISKISSMFKLIRNLISLSDSSRISSASMEIWNCKHDIQLSGVMHFFLFFLSFWIWIFSLSIRILKYDNWIVMLSILYILLKRTSRSQMKSINELNMDVNKCFFFFVEVIYKGRRQLSSKWWGTSR